MKTVQKYWVLSLLMMAGLIFAGCGDTTGGDSATDTGTSTSTDEDGAGDSSDESGEGSADNASNNTGNGDFRLVSLNVPHMS